MDHLVHVEQKEIVFDFQLGRKCRTTLHIRNLMHTMPVAFKLQTTSPHKFCVRPPNGYLHPLSKLDIEIILNPQRELPSSFPFSKEKFVLKTALAHATNDNSVLPERVPNDWFSSPQTRVFIDAKLKVVYVGASLLWHCVAREDEHAAREMLARHTGLSIAGEDGRTALHIAASIGNFKMVDMLLECGAEINATDLNGRTPLWEAVHRGHVDVVKELLKGGAHIEVNESMKRGTVAPIHIAATLTSKEVLDELIQSGANLETEDQEGRTAMHFAVESKKLETLKVLLLAGANKNAQRGDRKTPLLIAAENGFLEGVQLLLKGGNSPHVESENGHPASEMASERRYVAIMEALQAGEELLRAARQGDAEALATLLRHRAGKRAWATDGAGWTPLHVAAFKGHVQIVQRLLLEEGGRTALQMGDVEGHTPLHCAAEGGSAKMVQLLLAMGADPLATSNRGATPLDLANALGFTMIAKLIQHHTSISPEAGTSNSNKKIHPLHHRRSISPGPNLTSYMPSENTNENHKEVLSVSSVRFSTPTKLHQNNSRRQLLSSLLNHTGSATGDTGSYSSRNKQQLTYPQPQVPMTSGDIKLMQSPVSPRFSDAKDYAESKPLALAPSSSSGEQKTSLAHLQDSTDGQVLSCVSQAGQNPSVNQLYNDQLRQVKRKVYSLATPQQQHMVQNGKCSLQSSYRESSRQTLATLLERGHDSKMEFSASSSKKLTQDNPIPELLQHSSPDEVKDNLSLADGNLNQKAYSLFQKNIIIPKEAVVLTSNAHPLYRPIMTDTFLRDGHQHSSLTAENLKLCQPSTPNQEPTKQSSKMSSTTKPLCLGPNNKVREEVLNRSLHSMQLHSPTEEPSAQVDGLAFDDSFFPVQPQHSEEVMKRLAFDTPRREAQRQLVHEDNKQHSEVAAVRAGQKMAPSNAGQDMSKSSLSRSKPPFSRVETSASTISEGLNKRSSMQLQSLNVNQSAVNGTPTDKFAVQVLHGCEYTHCDLKKQCMPSDSPSCKVAGITNLDAMFARAFEGQANLLEGSLTRETPPNIVPDESSSDFCIQSECDIRLPSASDDLTSPSQEMRRSDGVDGLTLQQTVPFARTPEQVQQEEDIKLRCIASLCNENRPIYAPPLTIKQMKKPVSTPLHKTRNFLQHTHVKATSEAMPAVANVKKPPKPRSLIF